LDYERKRPFNDRIGIKLEANLFKKSSKLCAPSPSYSSPTQGRGKWGKRGKLEAYSS
jgi:hypothetical protein